MNSKDAKIYVSSINNVSKRLEHYGDVDIESLSLLKLIYKYANNATTQKQLRRLDSMVAHLQRTDSNICLEIQAVTMSEYTAPIGGVTIGVDGNEAPTLTDSSVVLLDPNETFTFSFSDLFSGYSDDSSGTLSSFAVKTLPSNGTLTYDGQAVSVNTLMYDATKLVYARNSDQDYTTSFTYSAYDDDNQLKLESNTANCNITVQEIVVVNAPATVGNTNIYADNRETTVLYSSVFTSQAVAPYDDPEGDELNAIKILSISSVNGGTYFYYGDPVAVGQIIYKAELDSGAFYHVAPDSNAIKTDTISVAIRDSGSMIWVN